MESSRTNNNSHIPSKGVRRTNGAPASPPRQMSDIGCQTDVSEKRQQQCSRDWSDSGPASDSPGGSASSSNKPQAQAQTQAQRNSTSKKSTAGVNPDSVADYFADKQTAAPGSNSNSGYSSNNNTKNRTSSTTGVVGEGKKCVRSQQPSSTTTTNNTNGNTNSNNNSNGGKSEGPSWFDEKCKLRLCIRSFSHLDETLCSEPKMIEGVSWKIMVMPKQHMVQKRQQKCMGFFLQCSPERAYSDQWSVHAIADMRMLSYRASIPHFARRTTHTYTSKENDWGYSCFMTWADILDESQGYINDDCVILEIAVKAEAPKNMMSHSDFLDKIQKWIVLADMQMTKGNVDLALEANESAIKFCKGKDDNCLLKLEDQRKIFVNAKLVSSIQRIESKGKTPVQCVEPTHGKPTSLRQALSGAQKTLSGKITAKGGKKTRAVVTVQHMKNKKKPYENNSTNQQRVSNGNSTVKDLVEIRKNNNKSEAAASAAASASAAQKEPEKTEIHPSLVNYKKPTVPPGHVCDDSCRRRVLGESDEEGFLSDEEEFVYQKYEDNEANDRRYAKLKSYPNPPEEMSDEDEDEIFGDVECPPEHAISALNNGQCPEPEFIEEVEDEEFGDDDDDDENRWDESGITTGDNELLYQGENSKQVVMCDRVTQTENDPEQQIEEEGVHDTSFNTIDLFRDDNQEEDDDEELHNDCPPFKRIREDLDLAARLIGSATTKNGEVQFPNVLLSDSMACYNYMFSKKYGSERGGTNSDSDEQQQQHSHNHYTPSMEFHAKWMDNVKTSGDVTKLINAQIITSGFAELNLDDSGESVEAQNGDETPDEGAEHEQVVKYDAKLLKDYFNVEGAILHDLKEDSVLGRLSDDDRKDIVDDLSAKISPLIVTLDLDFRDSFCSAQLFLEESKVLYSETQTMLDVCEKIRNNLEDKIYPLIGEVNGIDKSSLHTKYQQKESTTTTTTTTKVVTTSAAATSGAKPKNRHTIIARRTRQVFTRNSVNRNEEANEPANFELPVGPVNTLTDLQLNLRNMNEWMSTLVHRLRMSSKKLRQSVGEIFGDEGAPKMLRVLYESRNNQMDALNDEITTLKCQVDELKRENDNLQMRASVLGGELLVEKDKHKNCAKEIKDVRNTLKKAENRATKEENRANSNQIQLNDAEEKAKSLRKELDSVKKKSAEERTKTKKEKDRDTQTIRAQANEINAREKERDRAMGDLEDMRKVKDRVEKENGRLNSQLGQMVDRARSAEASVLEARMSGCLDVLNRRKTELQSGFDETQKNLNIVRQASDRDLLRKSLTEWRTALDKCDQHIRSTTSQYESSIKNVRSGSSTLSQIGDIKIPSDPLPKLVKPPPVQVVAPSSVPGVIGQRSSATTSAASRTNTCSGESPTVSACSTPSRSRVSRLPSPVNNSSAAKPSEPNNFWSWNTIGNLGSFGESSNFNSSFDQLHRDIWAMNGNGSDFQRSSSLNSSVSAPQASRQISAPPQISQAPLAPRAPATSTNSTTPFLTGFNTDIWNYQAQPQQYTPSSQQQPQRLANYYGAPHNGAGDQQQQHQQMSNGSALFANLGMLNPLSSAATNPWRAPPTSSNSNSATSSSQNPPPF